MYPLTTMTPSKPHLLHIRLKLFRIHIHIIILPLPLRQRLPLVGVPPRLGHIPRLRPARGLVLAQAVPEIRMEPRATLVERERVPEVPDVGVGFCKREPARNYADGADCVPASRSNKYEASGVR